MHPRRILLAAAAPAVAIALAGPASAHVTPSETTAPAGSYLTFALRVPHGCGEVGNTTRVEVQIPEGITSVTPQVVPGWTIERTIAPMDPPLDDGHGGQITERTALVTWSGGPLAHDQLEEFGLSVKLPEETGTLTFPTIQTCDDGTTAEWIQSAAVGSEEPERPAPAIEVEEAEQDGPDATAGGPELDAAPVAAVGDGSGAGDDGDGLAVAGLVVGALGLLTGGVALARTRRAG